MRSHWVDRLLGRVGGGDQRVIALPMGIATVVPSLGTGKNRRVDTFRATNSKRFARICLGIGDGTVRRQ